MNTRSILTAKTKRDLAVLSGYKCSFPGCDQNLILDGKSFVGLFAAIEAIGCGGPRYNPDRNKDSIIDIDNYILLCSKHHIIVDLRPDIYSVEWLKRAREAHFIKISKIVTSSKVNAEINLDDDVELSLEKALVVWNNNRDNPAEEFWHNLLQKSPSIISQAFPQSMFQFGSKCFVGGKGINNSGGNLVDFIYANKLTGNVVLIEIKTPKTKLLGRKYRGNAYSISEDLSGSFVQVLNYRDQLMKQYYQLSRGDDGNCFSAFNPKCLIIAGTLESELQDPTQYKSFELFRNSTTNVEILTYDELFQKAQDILDLVKWRSVS